MSYTFSSLTNCTKTTRFTPLQAIIKFPLKFLCMLLQSNTEYLQITRNYSRRKDLDYLIVSKLFVFFTQHLSDWIHAVPGIQSHKALCSLLLPLPGSNTSSDYVYWIKAPGHLSIRSDPIGLQARREPQRSPGKHYRGALSPPPHSVSWDRYAEGGNVGRGVPSPSD